MSCSKLVVTLKPRVQISETGPLVSETKGSVLETKSPVSETKLIVKLKPEAHLIDLRVYHQTNQAHAKKNLIIDVFTQLHDRTMTQISQVMGKERTKHQYRLKSFKTALNELHKYPGEIHSGYEARQVMGASLKMVKRIDEILQTGTLAELSQDIVVSPYQQIINQLLTVYGVGEATAKVYAEAGITGVDDLRQKVKNGIVKATHGIQVGLKYHQDILQKIPYQEIRDIRELMMQCVAPLDPNHELSIEVCGSHRRQKAVSGDIDVLVTHRQIQTENDQITNQTPYLKMIVVALKQANIIVADLTSHGYSKFMGVCQHPVVKIGRRIDMRFVCYESYPSALLYFTGSAMLNKAMRTIALNKGYTLSEYGLYRYQNGIKGTMIPTKSEADIFRLLGIRYLEPSERELI